MPMDPHLVDQARWAIRLAVFGAVVPVVAYLQLSGWMAVKHDLAWEEGFGCVVGVGALLLVVALEVLALWWGVLAWSIPMGKAAVLVASLVLASLLVLPLVGRRRGYW